MYSIMRSIRRLAALAVVAVVVAAAAEPFEITGRVVDAGTGRPLEGAQILVAGTNLGTLTDADGRYSILVPESRLGEALRIAATLIGYGQEAVTVRPADHRATGSVTVDFRMHAAALELNAVAITAGRAEESRSFPAAAFAARRDAVTASGVRYRHDPRGWDREQYAHIEENDFLSVEDNPLSTFSIDVDRASYSNVRRFLVGEGRLPPVDAVQVEEMINYFPYEYALPEGDAPVAITTELGRAPWREGHQLLRIGLASTPIDTRELPPGNLVFLLDVSGSMQSPDKLPLVKRSLRLLVDQLREEDRVAIVVYAGAAGLVLEPTSGVHRGRILEAIERLEAGGSTAGGAGLRLAYDVARRHFVRGGNNRVILATDGDFNVGESSDGAMVRLVEERREEGTFLTVLGFGTGNLQSTKMQEMAQHGNGNYAYIDGLQEARKVLVGEMGGTLLTVAKDVKVQVEFNPAAVRAYRLIGYENRLLAAEDFNDDRKDAGEMGAGHTVTALYEIVPVGSSSRVGTPGVDPLRYGSRPTSGERSEARGDASELAFVKVRYKEPTGSESRLITRPVSSRGHERVSRDYRFVAAVAGFGMLLRGSEHRGTIGTEEILSLAHSGLGADPQGYRREFIEIVRAYESIAEATDPHSRHEGRR